MELQKVNRLKAGNLKLKNMLVFDLPAVKTCLNNADCAKTCYAIKAQRQYPGTVAWREQNLHLARDMPDAFERLVRNQLGRTRKKVVRIHSAGDFFSQAYIDLWAKIIKNHRHIRFFAFTKVKDRFDFSALERLRNFNLISSYIGGDLNYGSHEYVDEIARKHGAFICPATLREDVKCNDGCTYCLRNKNVAFIKH